MSTAKTMSELDAAIERAMAANLDVVATGRRKADRAPIFCVPSQREPNRLHVLVLLGNRLTCDCQAAQHGTICAHRAAAHMYLTVQAALHERRARYVEERLREEGTGRPT